MTGWEEKTFSTSRARHTQRRSPALVIEHNTIFARIKSWQSSSNKVDLIILGFKGDCVVLWWSKYSFDYCFENTYNDSCRSKMSSIFKPHFLGLFLSDFYTNLTQKTYSLHVSMTHFLGMFFEWFRKWSKYSLFEFKTISILVSQ